ncbi:MAG: hypothetical protein WC379_14030 [Methanoregula sp.]|jgi:hypothetical protein
MRGILFFFLVAAIILVTGCVTPAEPTENPIGKGYLDLCTSDPEQADFWRETGDTLWNSPEIQRSAGNRAVVAGIPACENGSVTIWGYEQEGGGWYRVTTRATDGISGNGWLVAGHLHQVSNETGTEWSTNYHAIVGRWYQTGRGNGAKIWYEFNPDGTFTFNYDMMGNSDNMQDKGSWTYLGNNTYDLISTISADHNHTSITINPKERTFNSGILLSSRVNNTLIDTTSDREDKRSFDPPVESEIVYAKE